jgi:GTPase
MSRIVAIVGRPNVGKSTFFNRITQTQDAIVDEMSGVTRDRHYGQSEWCGCEFSIIDTGGYVQGSDDIFEEEICKQVKLAIDEADLIVMLVDVTSGVTDMDDSVADMLRRSSRKVCLVVNKVDNQERMQDIHAFHSLGLGELYPISAITGSGTGELLDAVVEELKDKKYDDKPDLPRFAIVGRPNVGKSTLLNTLTGDDRSIVTPIAGTTRDTLDIRFNKFGHDFYLVDTAGLRKRAKVTEDIEFYSVLRSVRTIEKADVCIIMIDAAEGIQSQDINIINLAHRNNKGIVLVFNKWDLLEKDHTTMKLYTENIKKRIAPFNDVPIIFTSAIEKQRILNILDEAVKVYKNRTQRLTTSKLNEIMLPIIENYPPPMYKGKEIKIKFIQQLKTYYPSFSFYCNLPQYVKEPYTRFLENKLREKFNFTGTPIKIYIRKK